MTGPRHLAVAVLIVNYNGREVLDACLDSWRLADPAPAAVLVVDNGSSDDSVRALRARYPWVRWLPLSENLGFAAGNNRGLEWLRRHHGSLQAVFLCNNDTTVDPQILEPLWRALEEQPDWAAVGPRILQQDSGLVWWEGATIERWLGRGRHWGHGQPPEMRLDPFELPPRGFLTGCGMMIRWTALEVVGGLDEDLWAYCEDADWCLRARAVGWACGVAPQAVMRHVNHATFSKRKALSAYLAARNSLRLIRRHRLGPLSMLWPITLGMLLLVCTSRVLRALGSSNRALAAATLAGMRDALRSSGPPVEPQRWP